MSSRRLRIAAENWTLAEPFQITGRRYEDTNLIVAEITQDGLSGRGEAAGVYYRDETVDTMTAEIEAVRAAVEGGLERGELQELLPAGGARNALDCALWDLEAKLSGRPAWQLAGLAEPKALTTTFTCGADTPERMASKAESYTSARALKLKLTGEAEDGDRVRAVRHVCPHAWIGVDANQGFDRANLERLLPTLVECRVALIEQPFPIGREADLDGIGSPIPIAADESVQGLSDIAALAGRFNVVNIKLDKCGGLTEALAMVGAAREIGLDVMVGNMLSTSLAMAPAYLVGQMCDIVDLDGPIFMATDRTPPAQYCEGLVTIPQALWGGPGKGYPG